MIMWQKVKDHQHKLLHASQEKLKILIHYYAHCIHFLLNVYGCLFGYEFVVCQRSHKVILSNNVYFNLLFTKKDISADELVKWLS